MPEHAHKANFSLGGVGNAEGRLVLGNGTQNGTTSGNYGSPIAPAGSSQAHNNMPPYIVVNYIIKAKQPSTLKTSNEAKVVNGYSDSITDTYSCDYINKINSYSTEETLTGETWIDGKPIYRKVIEYSTQPVSGDNTFYHGISNVDKFIDIETKIYRKDGVQHFAPRYTPGETSWNFYYNDITTTKIIFNCGSQLRNETYWGTSYFIFEYTKTTD